jgi:RNA polymerase sigma-70 factor (ECF subfamily)
MNWEVPAVTAPPPPVVTGLWGRALYGDAAAFESLSERYWYPAYAWLRLVGNVSADTTIHIVSFFARLQTTHPPHPEEPSAGRLRDFFLARLKEFAALGFPSADGFPTFLLDVTNAERRFAQEPVKPEDEVYARRWSLTVLENTFTALRTEFLTQGKPEMFEALKPFLGFNKSDEAGYVEAARAIGMSASAFHIAAYNFRMRYRELLRAMVADTVQSPEDVDSELTVLLVGAS